MKKFLALVLCVVMVFSVSVTASANSYPYYSSGEAVICNTIYSSCVVTIPSMLEMHNADYWYIEFTECDVMLGESIKVYVTNLNDNNAITLTDGISDVELEVALKMYDNTVVTRENPCLALVNVGDISQENTATVYFSGELLTDTTGLKAGNYEGRMQYEVAINPY